MTRRRARLPTDTIPHLPELEPGIQLLRVDSTASRAIHALTVDRVSTTGGTAYWIDSGRHARSDPLVALAPSDRILDRVRVARAFTPFQHVELLASASTTITDRTELLVVPDLDGYYRDDDLLADEGRDLLLAGIATLARVAREHDLSVLVTRLEADAFSRPIEAAASRILSCESTPFGPRFRVIEGGGVTTEGDDVAAEGGGVTAEGSDVTAEGGGVTNGCDKPSDGIDETLVYPLAGGRYVQTTIAFWQRVLAARAPLYEAIESDASAVGTRTGTKSPGPCSGPNPSGIGSGSHLSGTRSNPSGTRSRSNVRTNPEVTACGPN